MLEFTIKFIYNFFLKNIRSVFCRYVWPEQQLVVKTLLTQKLKPSALTTANHTLFMCFNIRILCFLKSNKTLGFSLV